MTESRSLHLRGALGKVREEMFHGRPHLVVPIVALMEGVIHAVNAETPELVTAKTLARAANSWNGRPLVLNHPTRGGEQVSANDPRVMESQCLGTIFNSRLDGKRLLMDGYVDIEKATKVGGAEFVEGLRAGGGCEVSVGAFVTTDNVAGTFGGKAYKAAWLETTGDHLALLPNGVGACSGKMGCGVNRAAMKVCDDALELEVLGDGSNQYGSKGGHQEAEKAHDAAAAAHTAAADKGLYGGGHKDAARASSAAEKATNAAGDGRISSTAAQATAHAHEAVRGTESVNIAQSHREAARLHREAADAHRSYKGLVGYEGQPTMKDKIKALLAPLLKALDDSGDGGDDSKIGALLNDDEPSDTAEVISYEAMRALLEQAKVSLEAGGKYVDDLIAAEGTEPEDESVETARLEALIAMCVQLYGTTNGIMKIASAQLRPEGSTSSYAYMEGRAAAGARNSKADQDIIQQTHDNSVKLGADCTAMKAAAATPCGCGGHDMDSTQRTAAIKTLSEMKDAKFTADELTGLSLLSDASVTKLTTLAAKSPADAIIQAKFAADSALAGHAHGINAKEAADKKKAEEDAAMKAAEEAAKVNGTADKLKAAKAAGHASVEEHEQAEFYAKNPEIKALVDGAKKRNGERKTELVAALKAASDRLTEEQLNAKSLEQLEELASFAQVTTEAVDFSGRGMPRAAEAATSAAPDGYAVALKAKAAR